jgi:hypothetical protein
MAWASLTLRVSMPAYQVETRWINLISRRASRHLKNSIFGIGTATALAIDDFATRADDVRSRQSFD